MQKKYYRLAAVISALCLTLSACAGDVAPETAPENIVAVNTAVVGTGDIQTELSFTGQVRPAQQITVMSRISGLVDRVMVNTGDFVSAGDVLFTMDETDLRNNINSLSAQLSTAETAVNAARTGVSLADGSAAQSQILQASGGVTQAATARAQAETGLATAERNVEQAELGIEQRELGIRQAQSALETAGNNYESMKVLYEFGDISKMEYDQAETGKFNAQIALENAEAALSAAQIALEQARNGHSSAVTSLAQAESSYNQALESYNLVSGDMPAENLRRAQDALAQAVAQRDSIQVNLNAARERLADTAVRSPISGVISSRNVEPQAMLLPNVAPFTIVNADTVRVVVNVTETIVNRIEPGQQVSVHIRAASASPYIGEVALVSPAADPATAAFSVEITIDNGDGLLKPGMFAEAYFIWERAVNTIVIPRGSVLLEDGEPAVYIAEDGRAVRRAVTTGIDTGDKIEITGGLAAGEMLIVTGQTFVRNGSLIYVAGGGEAR
jgi:RND family efflux transporter MFP subunit